MSTQALAQTDQQVVLAGGCFWCVEHDLMKVPGVTNVVSGYSGGTVANPEYKQVSSGTTGHLEVVQVTFDPARLSYTALVDQFLRLIDPYDGGGQFCDRGAQYRPAIFFADANMRATAEAALARLATIHPQLQPAVSLLPAAPFWPAEEYHQDYAEKNPLRYSFYRGSCGRDKRVRELWGKRP